MKTIAQDMALTILAIMIAIIAQSFVANAAPIYEMGLGGVAMLLIIFISIFAKKILPSSLPLFAYATLVGIIICLPNTPIRDFIITYTGKIDFLSCCVGLLAFAGLSVGGRIIELKQHSWKVILIFLLVSSCCFFGASIIAQIGFSIMGII